MGYDSASMMSSELESSSFIDSEEDEDASRSDSSVSGNIIQKSLNKYKHYTEIIK